MTIEPSALTIERLHRDHGDRIRRYLERLVGTAEAEDCQQEVFEKAQRAIRSFRGDSRVLTWLYRVATNVAIDRLRSPGRRADLEGDAAVATPSCVDGAAAASSERSIDSEVDRRRMRECIMRVVEQLPASQRAVILLGELRGLSDREMANALGISLGAAKIRLHRARRVLQASLERACTFERDEANEFTCAPKVAGVVPFGRCR
jgi:RNA polymerase sigma-70 factor (ECF subfamily)